MTRNDRLLLQLAQGLSVRDAAKQAGVSEPTVFRRLKEPDFISELTRLRGQLWDDALRKLTASACKAVERLAQLMNDADSENVKLKAAQLILEQGSKLRETVEFEQRLAALENQKLDEQTKGKASCPH